MYSRMCLPASSYTYGILAPSDLGSVKLRSGNQNAKQQRTLARAGFKPVVRMFGGRHQERSRTFIAVNSGATTFKQRSAAGLRFIVGPQHLGKKMLGKKMAAIFLPIHFSAPIVLASKTSY